MAITLVQSASNTQASGSTLTVTLGANSTATNCLVVSIGFLGATTNPTGATITLGGVAGNFSNRILESASGVCASGIWVCENIAGGQTAVAITLTGGSGTDGMFAYAYEFSGISTSAGAAVDKTAGTTKTTPSTSFTSTATATTTNATEAWVGIGAAAAGGAITMTGPTSPWTDLTALSGTLAGIQCASVTGYQITTSTGAATYSGTISTSEEDSACVITLLSAAGGGSVTGTFSLSLAPMLLAFTGRISSGSVTGTFSLALAPMHLAFVTREPLVLSIASTAGTDDYGNSFFGNGLGVYSVGGQSVFLGVTANSAQETFPTGQAIEKTPAKLFAQSASSGVAQYLNLVMFGPAITLASHGDYVLLEMNSPNAGGTSSANCELFYIDATGANHQWGFWDCSGINIQVAGPITAVKPGTGTVATPAVAESWHGMTGSYTNSWSDSGGVNVVGRYRLLASPPNSVQVQGIVAHAAGLGANSAFFTMPTGYVPVSAQLVGMTNLLPLAVGNCTVGNSGVLTLGGLGATTTTVEFGGIYSLD